MTPPRAAVIYNPVKAPLNELKKQVRIQEAQQHWAPTTWHPTGPGDFGTSAVRQALTNHPDVVIVVGGDEIIRAVASALASSKIPLALVPCGTGNLLARNLKTPLHNFEACILTAFQGSTTYVDMVVIDLEQAQGSHSTQMFLVMAGLGLDADMAAHTSTYMKKYLGWAAYSVPIARSVISHKLFQLTYRIDSQGLARAHAHTVIIGNCGTLTGNMLLLPSARLNDGILDVALLKPTGRLSWARIAARLALQGLTRRSSLGQEIISYALNHASLTYLQGQRFEATFTSPRAIELDGDSFGAVTGLAAQILPGALMIKTATPEHDRDLRRMT